MDSLLIVAEQLRRRLVVALAPQVREALEAIPDDRLWWQPSPECNPAGVLVLHLTGSIRAYLCAAIGGFPYSRDRAAGFARNRHLCKDALLEEFDTSIREAEATFAQLTAPSLAGPSKDSRYRILLEDIVGVVIHVSNHVGQLVYLAKSIGGGRLEPEVWNRNLAKA